MHVGADPRKNLQRTCNTSSTTDANETGAETLVGERLQRTRLDLRVVLEGPNWGFQLVRSGGERNGGEVGQPGERRARVVARRRGVAVLCVAQAAWRDVLMAGRAGRTEDAQQTRLGTRTRYLSSALLFSLPTRHSVYYCILPILANHNIHRRPVLTPRPAGQPHPPSTVHHRLGSSHPHLSLENRSI